MSRTDPVPVPPSVWEFPPVETADTDGLVGFGADLEPSTLIHAYRHGMFPMPASSRHEADPEIGWWSPPQRGVLDLDELRVTRSLRRSCRRYDVTVNEAFAAVIGACASLPRPGGWISASIIAAYQRLHELGWAHSVETWHDGELVGGLYGVQVNGLFAGESMFHRARDASKVALVGLVSALQACGAVLLDVQWATDHLATLGVREISRDAYLHRLDAALRCQTTSLAAVSGRDSLAKSLEYLDRIR